MSNPSEQIEALQTWINQVRQDQAGDSGVVNVNQPSLSAVLQLIQTGNARTSAEQGLSNTYVDLEREVQEQTDALTEATNTLKSQIVGRERTALKLRKAYENLEAHLQKHISRHSVLSQRLQEQIAEQKQLQMLEQQERALTEALRETLTTMSTTLDLDKILDHIFDTVKRIAPYDGANILLVESELVHVVRQRGYVEQAQEKDWLKQRIPITKLAALQQLIDIGKPLAIGDVSKSPMWVGFPGLDWISSNVIAPIRSNGKILGFLSLDSATPGFFTQTHADRLQAFADQTGIAIQNARLLDRAKRAAVMAERNRLANELHDTISQTLWSISLITERLPMIWEIDQDEGRRSLTTLNQSAQNALTEMRMLLLELHPPSLTSAKLDDLIRQAAEIVATRTGLEISVQVGSQDPVPSDVHFALYRVAQEALNNIVLHASAKRVEINFKSEAGRVDLTIHDNGIGFNPAAIGPGHLGLSIMKDRIQNIGGAIETISNTGQGTLIKIVWTGSVNQSE